MKLIVSLVFFSCFVSVIGCDDDDNDGATNGGASGVVGYSGAGGVGDSGAATAESGVSDAQGDVSSYFETLDGGDAAETVLPCTCTTYSVSWGEIGGMAAWIDRSSIAPCFKYTHKLTENTSESPGTAICVIEEPLCEFEGAIGGEHVKTAIENAEVQSALQQGRVLFGYDSRPVDGQVFELEIGNNTIEVGSVCSPDDTSCVPIPQGVQDLVNLLKKIDEQQFTEPGCPASMIRRSQ